MTARESDKTTLKLLFLLLANNWTSCRVIRQMIQVRLQPSQSTSVYLNDNFPWDTEVLLDDPVITTVKFADGTLWDSESTLKEH